MDFLFALFLFVQPPDPAEADRLEEEQAQAREAADAAEAEAEALAREIAQLQRQLVEAARRADAGERAALDAESAIETLNSEEAGILARLEADREALIDVLAAIQRVERQSPPALLAQPDDAADAARAAALMADIAPALRERADRLAADLDRLREVRSETETERARLSEAETGLADRRAEIAALIEERRNLEARRRGEAARYADAAREAGDRARSIRSLLSELQRLSDLAPSVNPRRLPPPGVIPTPRQRPVREGLLAAMAPSAPLETLRFADARGSLRPPAAGSVVRRFGEDDEDGAASEGIVIRTRARAQVISPFDGRVDFSGPWGSYGGLLILNVGDDYYVVLAGMTAVFPATGHSVLAGEPVGIMANRSEPAPELYLEVRRGETAVDPRPWIDFGTGSD